MKQFGKLIFCILYLACATDLFGQSLSDDNLKPCTQNTANRGKYKVLSIGLGKELQIDLEIKPKNRTDENFMVIAKEFKEKYCQEKQIRITYFESKKQWMILDPKEIEATPLAIYYFGKDSNEDGIRKYKIINGKVETKELKVN